MVPWLDTDTENQAHQAARCRLCNGAVRLQFSIRVLARYMVEYSSCLICGSLQTEPPYWLKDAYQHNLAILDTGAAQRNLANLSAAYVVARLLGMRDLLDFGGGDGLLCRLLRDYGLNCFLEDKYAKASYALAFTHPNFEKPELLLAFEVLEHFENPQSDLQMLFQCNPKALLASSVPYSMQDSGWWYLTPETGQHVFFYSGAAMRLIAKKWGFDVIGQGYYWLFIRSGTVGRVRKALASALLTRPFLRLVGALLRLMPTPAVTKDFNSLRSRDP
jgi:Methyltransferase domain